MWDYTAKVREHFLNPRNVGAIEDADAVGEVGSLACGDALKLYLKIDTESDRITDAKFQTFGCASAIASSSALTELIIGKTLDEALSITNKDIAEYLGGLPKEKMHCSVMGEEALVAAVNGYRGKPARDEHHGGKIVCRCFGVTDETIRRAIRENKLTMVEEVTHYTKAGGACGMCVKDIRSILDEENGRAPSGGKLVELKPAPKKKLTNIQRMQLIMKTIDEEIRPRLEQDGGDIELVDVEGPSVRVALRGRCSSCPSSQVTVKNLVEQTLRDHVDQDIVVEEVAS